ncbi:MAG: hypothetical protein FGF48_02475 [Candidatus Brockarchaeota archaeon]|nr:hypothetical protein [Candidatus Brockarchaeota archaeon]
MKGIKNKYLVLQLLPPLPIITPIVLCLALEDYDFDWDPKWLRFTAVYSEVRGLYNPGGLYYATYHRIGFGDCIDTHWALEGYELWNSYWIRAYGDGRGNFFGYYEIRRTYHIQNIVYAYSTGWASAYYGNLFKFADIGPPGSN